MPRPRRGPDAETALRDVGIDEPAGHRDLQQVRIRLPHRPRIGQVAARQQRDARRHHRQPNKVRLRPSHPRQQRPDGIRRVGCPLAPVHMRVGPVGDQQVRQLRLAVRDVAVQVQRAHDRHLRTYHLPQHRQHRPVRVRLLDGPAGAVRADISRVHRPGRLQPASRDGEELREQPRFHHPARWPRDDDQRHRLPVPGRVHAPVEARNLGRQPRHLGAPALGDRLALGPGELLEVPPRRQRREGIHLQVEPEDGDARLGQVRPP